MRKSFVSLFVGVTLALMAVFLISRYKNNVTSTTIIAEKVGTQQVVVASKDLPFGTKITRDHLTYAAWPKTSVSDNNFAEMEPLLKDEDGNPGGRIVLRQIYAGEPVIKPKVSGFGNRPTLSRKVAEDKRAFTIRINDVSGVAGFLLPGDKVDVMLTRPASGSGGNENLVTDVILQNVTVLGIDQLIDESMENPVVARTATVEVDTDEAQKLALAQQIGTLSLTLRNYSDNKEVTASRVSVGDLGGAKTVVRRSTYSGPYVRVRRGTAMDNESIR